MKLQPVSGLFSLARGGCLVLWAVGVLTIFTAPAQTTSLIPAGSVWKYSDLGMDLGTAWRDRAYPDGAWPAGPAQLGFGDGDETTLLNSGAPTNRLVTAYFRRSFVLTNVAGISGVTARLLYDDGAVVYVNGVEVMRVLMPAGQITYGTLASGVIGENAITTNILSPTLLISGTNVVAVEVHQVNATSSDLSFDFELTVLSGPPPVAAPDDQDTPAVASDGHDFLVLWNDRRDRSTTDWDIYGTRVTAAGEVLDRVGIPIVVAPDSQTEPAAAFDGTNALSGTNYLVVWTDLRESSDFNIYGARVSRWGQVLDAGGFPICRAPQLQSSPKVAFNGTEYLVVWRDYRNTASGPDNPIADVYAARVTRAGVVRDPVGLPIINAPLWQEIPVVATLGGDWVVVCMDTDYLKGVRVSAAGVVSAPFVITPGNVSTGNQITMAAGRTNYLLAWYESRPLGNNLYYADIWATRLGPNGVSLNGTGFGVGTNAGRFFEPDVAACGPDYLVVWQEGSSHSPECDVRGARVSGTGAVSPIFPINTLPKEQSQPAVAGNGTVYLVAWRDGRSSVSSDYTDHGVVDIYGTIVTPTGVASTNGFLISTYQLQTPVITWSQPAPIVYGTPLGLAQLNAVANVPGEFTYDPPAYTVLEARAHTLHAVFRPYDTNRYTEVEATVTLGVEPAPLIIRADDKTRYEGQPNPSLTASYTGLVAGERPEDLAVAVVLTTTATISSPPGSYPIMASGAGDPNYVITHMDGTLTVLEGSPCQSSPPGLAGWWRGEGNATDALSSNPGSLENGAGFAAGKVGQAFVLDGVDDVVRIPAGGGMDVGLGGGLTIEAWIHPTETGAGHPIVEWSDEHGGAPYGVHLWLGHPSYPAGCLLANVVDTEGWWHVIDSESGLVQPGIWQHVALTYEKATGQARLFLNGFPVSESNLGTFTPQTSYDLYLGKRPPGDLYNYAFAGGIDEAGIYSRALGPGEIQSIWRAGSAGKCSLGPVNPGALDSTFDPGTGTGVYPAYADRIALQPDSKILISGPFNNCNGIGRAGLARLHPGGGLDLDFAPSIEGSSEYSGGINAITVQPDGRILIGGWFTNVNGVAQEKLARLNPDGSLDESFAPRIEWGTVNACILDQEGRILIGGSFGRVNDRDRAYLARLHADGTLDPTFVPPGLSIGDDWYITALGVQSDGRILVAGHIFDIPWETYLGVVRLQPDGSLDEEFRAHVQADYVVFHLFVQPDDKILVDSGVTAYGRHARGPVARLNANGTIDTSFQADPGLDSWYWSMAPAPDGRLLLGTFGSAVQLNPDGSRNTRFECQIEGGADNRVWALAVQPDGRVLVSGDFTSLNGVPVPGLARVFGDLTPTPPVLGAPLESQVRWMGRSVTLTASASGSWPLSYQWLFNGTPIPGATGASLVLDNVQSPQAGQYAVVVSNGTGTITSAPATVAVRQAPTGPGSVDIGFDLSAEGRQVGLEGREGHVVALAVKPDGRVLVGGRFVGLNGVPRNNVAQLDTSGGVDLSFNVAGTDWSVAAVAVQPDGKAVIGGLFTHVNGTARRWLARLNADGTLDPGFAPDMERYWQGWIRALAVQPDGRILVAADVLLLTPPEQMGMRGPELFRLNPDGSVDAEFRSPVVTNVLHGARCLALQSDGKILVGYHTMGYRPLQRFNSDGSEDTSFRPVIQPVSGEATVETLALQEDGRIIIGGQFTLGSGEEQRTGLARLNADGTLDPSFLGYVQVRSARSIVVQPDGKIVVGGSLDFHWGSICLIRLHASGAYDDTFQVYQVESGSQQAVCALALLPDGRLAVGRNFNPSGTWDRGFVYFAGPDGRYDYGPRAHAAAPVVHTIVPQADGKVLVGGRFPAIQGIQRNSLARLNPDGSLDGNFDFSSLYQVYGEYFEVYALAPQPDGKVVIGGSFYYYDAGGYRQELARLNPDGSTDSTFLPPALGGDVLALALQADGKVIAGGWFSQPTLALARFNPDGSSDPDFAPVLGGWDYVNVSVITLQPDGRILVGGEFTDYAGARRVGLARLHPDGSLDESFEPPSGLRFIAETIVLQPDGRLLVGGLVRDEGYSYRTGLVRLEADGRLDPTFSTDWMGDVRVISIGLQQDGRLLIGGRFGSGAEQLEGRGVIRLNPDGSWDRSFVAEGATAPLAMTASEQVLVTVPENFINGLLCGGIARLNTLGVPSFVERVMEGLFIRLVAAPPSATAVYAVEDQPPPDWLVTDISDGGVFDTRTGKVKFGPFFDDTPRMLTYLVAPPPGFVGVGLFTGTASADGFNTPILGQDRIMVPWLHPADQRVPEWILSIGEVTAYGAAWRRGEPWPVPPVPIPIDYVTRAAALWRGGECYMVDSTVTTEPLWWVNCGLAGRAGYEPALQSRSRGTSLRYADAATRRAPSSYVPGEPVLVRIAVTPPAGAMAYAVEESVPPGWAIASLGQGGEQDTVNGKLKWGPFFDNTVRTLSYVVTPPVSAQGRASLAGVVSLDGASVTTTGALELAPGCRLEAAGRAGTGQLQLILTGPPGSRALIEASTDLRQWEPFAAITNTTGRVEFTDPDSIRFSHRFYRAIMSQLP